MSGKWLLMVAGVVCVGWLMAGEAPVYRAVKAEPIRMRQGIGNFLRTVEGGGEVTVAYLGGSITAANGWRPKTTAWLRESYPEVTFKEIHAAIGGTGSDLGVFRVGRDALEHDPDLLFVEFAVNDGGAQPEEIWRNMEGIVRQTWRRNPATDIVFTYTIHSNMTNDLLRGECPRSASAMELLADHYGIPSVNFAVPVVELLREGKLVFTADKKPEGGEIWFAGDSCHPRDEGHDIYRDLMAKALVEMRNSDVVDHKPKLESCFVVDHREAAKMVPIRKGMLSGNWVELAGDEGLQKSFGERMGQIWSADEPGSKLNFRFRGSLAKIYDLVGPDGGQVSVVVNGKGGEKPRPRFDSYCTYHRIANLGVVSGKDDEVYEVVIEIHPEQPDRSSVAGRLKEPERELAEPKYQGTKVWMSQLMLVGDLID